MSNAACPCGAESTYVDCCAPVHRDGAGFGASAESLMRARYSAYVLQDRPFLLRSWHPDTRPGRIDFPANQEWHGLTVFETERGGPLDGEGWVTFSARFRSDDEHLELRERSRFLRVDGQWQYVDGEVG